jgi:hypothetical protein
MDGWMDRWVGGKPGLSDCLELSADKKLAWSEV